ncbi:TPA: hypothetical protein N0F65_002011 [Lagenidium giganteum]|uniref:FYVE-type domain-containing protein n=1 Tax=Lagenidium giganteum TaxID=4803 RepID=A0AAV2YZ81_9STRA|nr:TPA: hypothetical protein N0F65_002011 [Lagenidium giganteum]
MMHALLEHALTKMRREKIYGGLDESWRDIGANNGFKRYTKVEGKSQHYRVQGTVRTAMTNLMSAFDVHHDNDLLERRKFIYGDALDGQTLYVIKGKTPDQPHQFLGIRWEAINVNSAADGNRNDVCYLEYAGITCDADGNQVGFKVSHSIPLNEVPSLKKHYGLVRAEGTEVILLRSSRNNHHTQVIMEGSLDYGTPLPGWALSAYLSQLAANLYKLPVTAQNRRLSSMPLLDKSDWVPSSERKNCNVCLSKFGMLSKKHHCRVCGEVICKSCITEKDAEEEVKFCKKCIIIACNHDDYSGSERDDSCSSSLPSRLSGTSSVTSSASVFMPPNKMSRSQNELKYLDEYNQVRDNCNSSLTASESSYDSASSYMDPDFELRHGLTLEEESVMVLDTRDMRRGAPRNMHPHALRSAHKQHMASLNPAASQSLEESIAEQRYLLQEMMSAARGYQSASSR